MEEPEDALRRMRSAVAKAKRKASVDFPVAFVWADTRTPMLSRLLGRGRGGEVRLRLYLTMRMQATAAPYALPGRTSSSLAGLLNLPSDTGPRRVTDALNWLETNKLLHRTPIRGKAAGITLLSPDGSGDPLTDRKQRRYVTLPVELWSDGWIFKLSGRSLAVYTALRDLLGGKGREGAFMPGDRKVNYGMSDDTWTRAIKELRDLGILFTWFENVGDDEHYKRRRQRYFLRELSQVEGPFW